MPLLSDIRKAYWLAVGRVQDHGPQTANLREPTQDRLGLYCADFRPALTSGHFVKFDDNEIPLKDLGGGDYHYNPTRVASYAFGCVQRFASTGEDMFFARFIRQADWFVRHADRHECGGTVWRYDFPHLGLPAGWISAMAQGQAISVLTRAFLITENTVYLDVARRALSVFDLPVDRGGVVSYFKGAGEVAYEEMPLPRPSRILNGWIYALWGLRDLSIAGKDAEAERLYRVGLASLLAHLEDYDTGWWSTYDLPDGSPPRLASFCYHMLGTWQLESLAARTGEDAFAAQARRWKTYAENLYSRTRATLGKLYQRVTYGY